MIQSGEFTLLARSTFLAIVESLHMYDWTAWEMDDEREKKKFPFEEWVA